MHLPVPRPRASLLAIRTGLAIATAVLFLTGTAGATEPPREEVSERVSSTGESRLPFPRLVGPDVLDPWSPADAPPRLDVRLGLPELEPSLVPDGLLDVFAGELCSSAIGPVGSDLLDPWHARR